MIRRIRFAFVLFVAVVKLSSTGSAVGQLSRARKAVRKAPAVAPQPAPAPEEAKEERPRAAKPKTPPTATPPAPKPDRRSTRRTDPAPAPAVAPTPQPRSLGSLGRARQQVRPAAPQQPTVQPRPPKKRTVHHKPQPTRRSAPRRPAPLHSIHRHPSRSIAFAPAACIHDTVIINEVAPPPVTVFEQPLLVPQQPAVEQASPPSEHVPSIVNGGVVGQPDFISPRLTAELGFQSFPYEFGNPGVMAFGLQKQWSGSAGFEYGSSFDGLDRRGFGFLLEHSSRVGIDVKWDSYIEDLGGGFTDELHLTDINVLFRVAESPDYLVRAGIGANILGDAFGTDGGFNATIKADFFPAEPLVLSAEVDMGTIGDAELFHAAGKIGLMMDRFELFGGYDYRTIGGVPLQGAMIGLQVWF